MTPQPGEIYQHYKGKKYKILSIGRREDTLEVVVVYEAQYEDPGFGSHAVWVRALTSFMEKIEVEIEGKTQTTRRFTLM